MHASFKYRHAYPDPDVDAPKAPELHSEVTKLITLERPQEPNDVPTVELTPPFSRHRLKVLLVLSVGQTWTRVVAYSPE